MEELKLNEELKKQFQEFINKNKAKTLNEIAIIGDDKERKSEFENWLKDYQFETDDRYFFAKELETEKFIVYDKNKKTVSRFENVDMILSVLENKYNLSLKTVLKSKFVICRIIFDPKQEPLTFCQEDEIEKFIINTYFISEIEDEAQSKKNVNGLELETAINYLDKNCPNISVIINNLFQKPEEKKYIINWLAYIAQTKNKTRNSIVIKGVQGSGKNVFFEKIITPFFSKSHCVVVSNEIFNRFNSLLENKTFIAFNEIKPDFKEGSKVYEILKEVIADDTLTIETKFQNSRKIKNVSNCIFFSNHSIPIVIDMSDRRYSIINCMNSLTEKYSFEDLAKIIEIGIPNEIVNFWTTILSIKFNGALALSVLQNEQKEIIQKSTTEIVDVFAHYIYKKDFDNFFEFLENETNTLDIEIYINNLKTQISKNFINSATLFSIYRVFKADATLIKFTRRLSAILGQPFKKEIEGIRYYGWSI